MSEVWLWVPTGNERPESWLQVQGYMDQVVPDGYRMKFKVTRRSKLMLDVWNKLIKEFLASDADWLWSVHDDVVVHPQSLERLLSWNKKLVGALIFHRKYPALPHVWIEEDPEEYQQVEETKRWFMAHQGAILPGPIVMNPRPDEALIEASFTTHSCVLMHRSVLEDMGDNWFAWEGEGPFKHGEDRRFFKIAREAGHQLYIDRSVIAGHLFSSQPTGAMDFMLWEYHPLFAARLEDTIP